MARQLLDYLRVHRQQILDNIPRFYIKFIVGYSVANIAVAYGIFLQKRPIRRMVVLKTILELQSSVTCNYIHN